MVPLAHYLQILLYLRQEGTFAVPNEILIMDMIDSATEPVTSVVRWAAARQSGQVVGIKQCMVFLTVITKTGSKAFQSIIKMT